MATRFVMVGVVLALGCGNEAGPEPVSSSSGAWSTSTPSASESARPAADPGSVAALKEKAIAVMDALKKGDAKAAADHCLGKHRDGLEKFIAETFDKKEQGRTRSYAAWDGKLGEIRADGDNARVLFGEGDGRVHFLSFRKKDGAWSLDDIPAKPRAEWDGWGKVVTE